MAVSGVAPAQSARGLAHSKTLRAVRWSFGSAPASWSAVALHRFFIAHETHTQFQTPFAPFVHPKLPLGLCGRPPWRTATNWDFAGERARPGSRFRPRAVVGMARCAVRRPALSCPRRAGRNSAGQKRERASGDIAAQCPYQSAVRRGIFVEYGIIKFSSSVGAAYSDDVAPTELDSFAWRVLQRFQSYGLRRLRALRVTKIQPPFAPFVHPKLPLGPCGWPSLAHGHQLGLCRGARPSRWPFSASRRRP